MVWSCSAWRLGDAFKRILARAPSPRLPERECPMRSTQNSSARGGAAGRAHAPSSGDGQYGDRFERSTTLSSRGSIEYYAVRRRLAPTRSGAAQALLQELHGSGPFASGHGFELRPTHDGNILQVTWISCTYFDVNHASQRHCGFRKAGSARDVPAPPSCDLEAIEADEQSSMSATIPRRISAPRWERSGCARLM